MKYLDIIQDSIDYIEENLKADLSVEELANRAGFSLYYYYRIFTSITGLPVIQYIVRRKLRHAIYEIQYGRKQIEVALEYGFNTNAGFFKAFKKEFDCSPSDYKRKFPKKYPKKINLRQERYYMITHSKLKEILKNWTLEEPIKITDIHYESDGEKMDDSWSINDKYCLRTSVNLTKSKNYIDICRALSKSNVQVETPILTNESKEYYIEGERNYCLFTTVEGNYVKSKDCYQGNHKEKAEYLGQLIGKLHSALSSCDKDILCNDINLYKLVNEWCIPAAKNELKLPENFYEDYKSNFGRLIEKLPKHVIHRNPHPGNIVINNNNGGFLKFDISERNVRLFDPCYLSTAILAENFERENFKLGDKWIEIVNSIIKGYDSICNLTKEEKEAVIYVIYSIQLIFIAYFKGLEGYEKDAEMNCEILRFIVNNREKINLG